MKNYKNFSPGKAANLEVPKTKEKYVQVLEAKFLNVFMLDYFLSKV